MPLLAAASSRFKLGAAFAALVVSALLAAGGASAAMTTAAGDASRMGWYPDEPQLNPSTVAGGQVHQAFSAPVTGQVYGQPLVANNTLFVTTQDNWIYGLDPNTGAQRWARQLGAPFDISHDSTLGCQDIQPHVGITSTPVIDAATNTAYLLAKNPDASTTDGYAYFFHAIDLTTGQDRFAPTRLADQLDQNTGSTHFRAHYELQRPALLLMNGVVYAAFASHCDADPSQGWVAGFSTSGALRALWTTRTGDNSGGGIWQDGGGIVSDGPGQLLLVTGSNNSGGIPGGDPNRNGTNPNSPAISGSSPPADIGESVVRLQVQPSGALAATDFFSPHDNWLMDLSSNDSDINSGGPALLPDSFGAGGISHLMVAAGKSGDVFLLNRDSLGGFAGSNGTDNVVQRQGTTTWPYGPVVSRFAVWPGDGGYVYSVTGWWGGSTNGEFGNGGPLNVYRPGVGAGGRPVLNLVSSNPSTNTPGQNMGYASSGMAITSNGTASGSAVAWMVWNPASNGVGAQLRAYNAVPQGGQMQLLWSAPIGTGSKFSPPAISDDHVYVGTRDGHVVGFAGPPPPPPPAQPAGPGAISLSGLSVSPKVFPPATVTKTKTKKGKSKKKTTGGARIKFRLSRSGTVAFYAERSTTGRRVKRACVRASRKNRGAKRCTLWVKRPQTMLRQGHAGLNVFSFDGRLGGRRLPVGTYRLVATPIAADGARGAVQRTTFRVVKPKTR